MIETPEPWSDRYSDVMEHFRAGMSELVEEHDQIESALNMAVGRIQMLEKQLADLTKQKGLDDKILELTRRVARNEFVEAMREVYGTLYMGLDPGQELVKSFIADVEQWLQQKKGKRKNQ